MITDWDSRLSVSRAGWEACRRARPDRLVSVGAQVVAMMISRILFGWVLLSITRFQPRAVAVATLLPGVTSILIDLDAV